jgi:hypothetical protein
MAPIVCRHCGRLADSREFGLCRACHAYQQRRGIPRPPRLWRNAPCECGRPGAAIVVYTLLTAEQVAYEDGQVLCAECLEIFLADERPGAYRVIRRPERGRRGRARAGRCSVHPPERDLV